MARRYRVIHQRKKWWEAALAGRAYAEWYTAQYRAWYGWREIAVYPSRAEAESACSAHAGGTLLVGGTKVVAEFETPD